MTGVKYDKGKTLWNLVPFRELKEVVDVLQHGAEKYSPDNWKYVKNPEERYRTAAMRHLVALMTGNEYDDEEGGSGMHHAAHLACNALFLLWFKNEMK